MTDLLALVQAAFPEERMPTGDELVRFDGIDDPGKEYLQEQLSGKTAGQILDLLRSGALGNGSMITEELELAELNAIRYYLGPFLLHLLHQVRGDRRAWEDESPFFLFAHIRNILDHRGRDAFTDPQLRALAAIVDEGEKALSVLPPGIWTKDVVGVLQDVRRALQAG